MELEEQVRLLTGHVGDLALTTRKFKARFDMLECVVHEFMLHPSTRPALAAAIDQAKLRYQRRAERSVQTSHPEADAIALELWNELKRGVDSGASDLNE